MMHKWLGIDAEKQVQPFRLHLLFFYFVLGPSYNAFTSPSGTSESTIFLISALLLASLHFIIICSFSLSVIWA